ncbi:hypothetical protein ACFPN7_11890 [Amycolatopsis halotolerans]|uniref:hypothetical protein n=1 Tax=Amycolatopsis halotolerans TaxID=330083 RepID=UPI0036098F42
MPRLDTPGPAASNAREIGDSLAAKESPCPWTAPSATPCPIRWGKTFFAILAAFPEFEADLAAHAHP